jgi:hypothetical protein
LQNLDDGRVGSALNVRSMANSASGHGGNVRFRRVHDVGEREGTIPSGSSFAHERTQVDDPFKTYAGSV